MIKLIINNMPLLGARLRRTRKDRGAKQSEVAHQAGVGLRFLSELENGKQTAEMGKVLNAIDALGLELVLQPKAKPPKVKRAFGDMKFEIMADADEE